MEPRCESDQVSRTPLGFTKRRGEPTSVTDPSCLPWQEIGPRNLALTRHKRTRRLEIVSTLTGRICHRCRDGAWEGLRIFVLPVAEKPAPATGVKVSSRRQTAPGQCEVRRVSA